MIDVAGFEARLHQRKQELENRLDRIEHELDAPMNADVEERATEREGDEALEDLGNAGLIELRMIRAALDRIAKGTYGVCAKCGEDISPERLEAVPFTPFCRHCAT